MARWMESSATAGKHYKKLRILDSPTPYRIRYTLEFNVTCLFHPDLRELVSEFKKNEDFSSPAV